jgi:hypothetical protein
VYKIGTVGGTWVRGRVNEGEEDERLWLMDFIYVCEIEQ